MEKPETLAAVRLDIWLWAARFYKTRALAVDDIDKGRVSVNGQVAKPSRDLRVGDTLALLRSNFSGPIITNNTPVYRARPRSMLSLSSPRRLIKPS